MSVHSAEVGAGRSSGANGVRTRIWNTAFEKCIPLGATIELQLGCNLRCTHCYNFDRSQDTPPDTGMPELTSDEVYGAIDALAEAGCLFLSFTGGEAMMHPDLLDFARYAREHRFAVKVKTNGTMLTTKTVAKMVDAGVLGVDISLYGSNAVIHDGFTKRLGSFKRTVEGIKAAKAAGLDVAVNISIVKDNVHQVTDMMDLCKEWGVGVGANPFITARYDGTDASEDLTIDVEQLRDLYRGPFRQLVGQPDHDPNRSVQCACARSNVAISATGEVYPCIGAPIRAGNIREQSFAEIWEHSDVFNQIRGLTLQDFKSCRICPDRPWCNRNSGVVYNNTGSYTGAEPLTCEDAAARRVIHEECET